MLKRILLASAAVVSAPLPRPALAWNGPGHEAVALIAWDQLAPAQRAAVVSVLRAHPRYEKDLMQQLAPGEDPAEHAFREAATWPDQVKSPLNPLERTEDHKNWHYVDYPYALDGKTGPVPPEAWDGRSVPVNLLQAMAMVTAQLRDPATPLPRQAIDLCWAFHLVGDMHQPLHAISRYSAEYPTGDQGGNLILVGTDDNPAANLHAVWDGIEGQSFSPRLIRRTADRAERDHPPAADAAATAVTDPKAWAAESYALATSAVYLDGRLAGLPRDQATTRPDAVPLLPLRYERDARRTADGQIALAGYRLAALLASLPQSRG